MRELPLTLACWDYDRTRPLIDGRVRAEGIALSVDIVRPQQAFRAMLQGKVDVAEMSLANFTALKARDACPFVGIPAMLSKMFRHSCIYVRRGARICEPADLKGKRAGTAQFTSTGVVFAKGMLEHDYGVSQRDMTWFIGALHAPAEPPPRLPEHPPGVQIEYLPEGRTLEDMFAAGEIDVLFANHFPRLWQQGSSDLARLFTDFKQIEQDYFARTGIFPIMHTVVIREDLVRAHPFVAETLYRSFCAARDIAVSGLYDTDALRLSLPWLIDHVEETRAAMGPDWFAYGIEPNRPALTAIGRYLYEQGLAPRIVTPDELFEGIW
jgi:4,5-dihydroxyphthalate decarboxylase